MQDVESEAQNAPENNTSAETKGGEGRVYELGFLLLPTIAEENVPAAYSNLKEIISSFHGEIISDEMPKLTPLAYSMRKVTSNIRSKFSTAYFGWVKFAMDGQEVVEMKKKLDLDPTVIRFLILKTVKENTIAGRRFGRTDMTYRKPLTAKKGENETVAPINKEEIDKEIDALIAA